MSFHRVLTRPQKREFWLRTKDEADYYNDHQLKHYAQKRNKNFRHLFRLNGNLNEQFRRAIARDK